MFNDLKVNLRSFNFHFLSTTPYSVCPGEELGRHYLGVACQRPWKGQFEGILSVCFGKRSIRANMYVLTYQ